MPQSKSKEEIGRDRAAAREIHELTYLKHLTGASEDDIRSAFSRVGYDRDRVERALRRPDILDR